PNRQGAEILPVMAAFASAQDWDGLFFFQYIDGDTWKSLHDSFSLSGDWAKYATAGTSAALFRQFQIRPLAESKTILLSADIRQMLG
ncbi:capsular biosynthesis protein, partial [Glaciimonas sp. Cout2]|nr:capsular biosynthesis protein [Glaciimonas sp. Cout2]